MGVFVYVGQLNFQLLFGGLRVIPALEYRVTHSGLIQLLVVYQRAHTHWEYNTTEAWMCRVLADGCTMLVSVNRANLKIMICSVFVALKLKLKPHF